MTDKNTDEWHENYEKVRKRIEALTPEERMARLEEMSIEVFIMVNSFAGEQEGIPEGLGVCLHEVNNYMNKAQKMFDGEIPPGIPADAIMRSMGLDIPGMESLRDSLLGRLTDG